MSHWNPNDFLCEGLQQAFSINHFQSSHPLSALKPTCTASFPKALGVWALYLSVIWDEVNNAQALTNACSTYHWLHTEEAYGTPTPQSIHSWWILIVRIVDSGRKQRAGLQHKNAGEERESPKRKSLESSSTSPLAVPSCWGSWQSWAACAACLGDGAGALYIDTWLVEQMRRQVWTKRKKPNKQERKKFGKFLLTAFQNSSVIFHTHLILLDCAIWQFSRV